MTINRKNYESVFLDYHDGNLDKRTVRDLMDFLAANPDLKDEFENFENISLNVEHGVKFAGKEKLKHNAITLFNYKTWLVAFSENDLNIAERIEVQEFLDHNPAYKAELDILNQTKLLPDYSIRFKNKSSLKKGGVVIPMWMRTAAAAAVVIGFLAYLFIGNESVKQVADVKLPVTNKQEIKITDNAPPAQVKGSEKLLSVKATTKPVKKITQPIPAATNSSQPETPIEKTPDVLAQQNEPVLNPKANDESSIVIHSTGNAIPSDNKPYMALNDKDLAELGLITKDSTSNRTFIQTAVNSVRSLLGLNVKYYTETNLVSSTDKTTLALGNNIEISRTVMR